MVSPTSRRIRIMARLVFVLLLISLDAAALEPRTAHTYRLEPGETPPDATLQDVAWLAGQWRGEAFGKQFEAVWNPPSAGSMVGFFKLMDTDTVEFYEFLTIFATDGRLGLRVKHFSAEFVAWEDKDEYVHFKLIGIEPGAIHFGGISFYRLDDDRMEAFIVFRRGDESREERLAYRRVR